MLPEAGGPAVTVTVPVALMSVPSASIESHETTAAPATPIVTTAERPSADAATSATVQLDHSDFLSVFRHSVCSLVFTNSIYNKY